MDTVACQQQLLVVIMCTKIVVAGCIGGVGLLLAALGGGLGWGLFPSIIEGEITNVSEKISLFLHG
jgi:hypothetical protein